MPPSLRRRSLLLGPGLLLAALALALPEAVRADDPPPEPSPAASEMLKSMREKGLLSEQEYEDLYRRQARYEADQRSREELPGWLRDWTFGGDMRFRFERRDFGKIKPSDVLEPGQDNIDALDLRGTGAQNRWRLRLRLGAEKRVFEGLTFGFRIATSSPVDYGQMFNYGSTSFGTSLDSDPRSENTTFGNLFDLHSLFVDRAYLRWQPDFAPSLMVQAGKFGNPFRSRDFPDMVVWDPDIQPEGVALDYRFDVLPDQAWLTFTGGAFQVQEVGSVTLAPAPGGLPNQYVTTVPVQDDGDPYLFAVQGGVHVQPRSWVRTGARVSYYDIEHVSQRLAAALEDLGNGGEAIHRNPLFVLLGPSSSYYRPGRSEGRIDELVVDAYARFEPWGERYRVTPFFLWSTIPTAHYENQAYAVGVELGDPTLLQLTVMWARVERNGTIALFTDSDLFEGFTNAKGWYLSATRQIVPGVRLRGAWMHSSELHSGCGAAEDGRPVAFCDTASQITAFGLYRKTTLDRDRFQVDLTVDF